MSAEDSQIRRISSLTRLSLSEEEISGYAGEFSKILKMIEEINSAETTGIEPLYHPLEIDACKREDLAVDEDLRDQFQEGAPQVENGYYLVPKFMD